MFHSLKSSETELAMNLQLKRITGQCHCYVQYYKPAYIRHITRLFSCSGSSSKSYISNIKSTGAKFVPIGRGSKSQGRMKTCLTVFDILSQHNEVKRVCACVYPIRAVSAWTWYSPAGCIFWLSGYCMFSQRNPWFIAQLTRVWCSATGCKQDTSVTPGTRWQMWI